MAVPKDYFTFTFPSLTRFRGVKVQDLYTRQHPISERQYTTSDKRIHPPGFRLRVCTIPKCSIDSCFTTIH
jgi:hypothetical protein